MPGAVTVVGEIVVGVDVIVGEVEVPAGGAELSGAPTAISHRCPG